MLFIEYQFINLEGMIQKNGHFYNYHINCFREESLIYTDTTGQNVAQEREDEIVSK